MSIKTDFVNWLIANVPGLDAYYGIDKINQWASGLLGSVIYDRWFNKRQTGDIPGLKADINAVITGNNSQYRDYMDKAKNSGDFMRQLINTISNFVQQTQDQVTMWQSIVLNSQTDQKMRDFAQSLLTAYQAQFKQASDTLALYKKDLADGIAKGIYI
ncbi:MAG: hypothetical protein KGH76_05970 [Thaumarchaeota archaeon]|nr:hypothetical protein [Nitrososphaerota archaeon]